MLTVLALYLLGGTSSINAQSNFEADRTSTLAAKFGLIDPWNDPAQNEFAPQTPGDSDLGEQLVLLPQSGYRPFSLGLNQRGIWTSNAALTDTDEKEDYYSNTQLSLQWVPQIVGSTFAEVSADYGFYRYADDSSLDFDNLDASIGLIHVFRDLGDLATWFRYNHTRLLTARGQDEIFTDHSLEVGFYFPLPLTTSQLAYLNYSSEFSLDGNPSYAARHEHGLTLGHRFLASDKLEFDTYYRIYVFDYVEGGRTDIFQSAGLSLTAHITEAIDLSLSSSYSINDSNTSGGDYEVGDIGAILSIEIEF